MQLGEHFFVVRLKNTNGCHFKTKHNLEWCYSKNFTLKMLTNQVFLKKTKRGNILKVCSWSRRNDVFNLRIFSDFGVQSRALEFGWGQAPGFTTAVRIHGENASDKTY